MQSSRFLPYSVWIWLESLKPRVRASLSFSLETKCSGWSVEWADCRERWRNS